MSPIRRTMQIQTNERWERPVSLILCPGDIDVYKVCPESIQPCNKKNRDFY